MNEIKKVNESLIYQGKRLAFKLLALRTPSDDVIEKELVVHPGAIVVVPKLNNGNYLLLHQYRYSLNNYIYEVPAGTIDDNETHLQCAKRELTEETGFSSSKMTFLGELYPAPGFCDEIQYCYLAEELIPKLGVRDEDELIEVKEFTKDEINQLILNNQLLDGKSIAVFYKLFLLGKF
ncbi:MAG: NUDIX hydrolase [Proteobacteria bacterium]|nr:NUDIX hydrolase [Pseudomonadota bacterium]